MAEQMSDAIISLMPVVTKNWDAIKIKINERRFKINKSNVSIYCTLFNRFKKNCQLEYINEIILKAIEPYKQESKDCLYGLKDTTFTLIPHFAYTQPNFVDFGLEEPEYRLYPDAHEKIMFVPGVTRAIIYVFFQQNTRESIINCQILLNKIQDMLLKESDVKQQGRFLYLDVENESIRNNILEKIAKKYNTDGYMLKNQSGADNEIKIRYSDSVFRIISGLLRT